MDRTIKLRAECIAKLGGKIPSPERYKTKIIENIRPRISLNSPPFSSELEVVYSNTEEGFSYRNDNGIIKRVLSIKTDPNYSTDSNYGAPQEWLLNNRQGDHYDRIPERISDQQAAIDEEFGMVGESTLTKGIVWDSLPDVQMNDPRMESYLKNINYSEDFEDED